MKKLIITFSLSCFAICFANAQISSGKAAFGGSLSMNFTPNFSMQLSPRAGFFLTDQFALGADINFDMQSAGGTTTTDLGISPNARYYFSLADKLYAFGHVAVRLNNITDDLRVGLMAYPGVAYFLTEQFAIEGSLAGLNTGGIGVFLLF
jgi:hypothetical protein